MQNLNLTQLSTEVQKPSIVGWSVTQGGCPVYCLKIDTSNSDIIIFQDFFTPLCLIDSDIWSITKEGESLIFSNKDALIKAEPIIDDTVKEIPQVKWQPELKAKNLLNKDLWEEKLIREIAGVTYYPLDLFRFTQHKFILQQPVMESLNELLKIDKLTNVTKTLYYYIKKDIIYVGVWDYRRYLPLDPIQCGLTTKETFATKTRRGSNNDLFTRTWLNYC